MKTLYFISGTMGVGKSTVCNALKKELPDSVFLDGDWCWDAGSLRITEETKVMVTDNICYLLNNFIKCSMYENIIFCWVMHEQSIIDNILSRLKLDGCAVKSFSLVCDEATLKQRLTEDIKNGVRSNDVIERSIARLPLYRNLNTVKIDTTNKSITRVISEIQNTL